MKLDYIPCGPLPPNPVELLAQGKTRDIFDQLKENYECIVVDTTPLAQVSDAYLLMEHADLIIMIVRYHYTSRKVFSLIMKDLHHKGIHNACILLNDNRQYHEQYGYGTGYSKT
jgi:Mrp family chromosome partitioning ATPase